MTAGTIILVLKVAVVLVTLLLTGSLIALAKGAYRWHGRINLMFFILTLTALLGLEVIARILYPTMFAEFFEKHGAQDALRTHLMFSLPAAVLLPFMLVTGYRHRRNLHITLGVIFLALWIGTFVTGVFYLPHVDP